jgi:large subunit ribosomal protein L5
MGVPDQTIFPEIDLASMPTIQGMNITFVTTAQSDTAGHALLKELGMPFRRAEGQSDQ